MLTIIEEVRKSNRIMYKVRCDCGKEEIKRKDHVLTNRSTMCKRCSTVKTAAKYPPPVNRTGYEGLSGTHYLAIKFGASRRQILFELTEKFLWDLYVAQQGICALTGVPIILTNKIKNGNPNWDTITASVDRVDSSKGYTEDNVWWVHKKINKLKNNLSMEEFLYWSKLLVDKHGNPEPSESGNILEGATTRDRVLRDSNYPQERPTQVYLLGDDIV